MNRRVVACWVVTMALVGGHGHVVGHGQVASSGGLARQHDLEPLHGRWVVVTGEHNGRPMDGLNGGVMTVDAGHFEIKTASGAVLSGILDVDMSMQPPHLDMLHADGMRWEAVFDVDGTIFRLNYVAAGGPDPRPTGFATLPTNEESLIVLQRADP